MITLIAAADKHNALGKGSDLLWHLPEDFKHFKRLTTGHCIIMGRKTFETFPKPLPNRIHIVITRQKGYTKEGAVVVSSVRGDRKGFGNRPQPLRNRRWRNLCASPPLCRCDRTHTGTSHFCRS